MAFWGFNINIDINIKTELLFCKHWYFLQEVCNVSDRERYTHVFTRVKCYWHVHLSGRRSSGGVHAVICAAVFLSDPERPHNPSDRETAEDEKRATDRE